MSVRNDGVLDTDATGGAGGGDASAANQVTGNASLSSIDGKLPALDAGRIPVILPAGGGGLTDAELRLTPVDVQGSVVVLGTVTVDAVDLDTRNLIFATDKADVSGSSVSVSNFPATQPISGTVDTELGAAVLLTDLLSTPTVPLIGGCNLIFDPADAAYKKQHNGRSIKDGSIDGSNISASVLAAHFDNASPHTSVEGRFGALRESSNRNLYIQIRDGLENERGVKVTAENALVVDTNKPSVATQTTVADSATSVTILAANAARLGATILNTSTATLRARLNSAAATLANYTVALVAGAYYEIPFGYTGEITGIWDTDPNTGVALVTEMTA